MNKKYAHTLLHTPRSLLFYLELIHNFNFFIYSTVASVI